MGVTNIRTFRPSDGNSVQLRLRSAWRLEIPKRFNLTQVIAEQPLGHAIVAACIAVLYAMMGDIGTLCMAIPGFYIALYFVVLIVFLIQSDGVLLKELADIPKSYQSSEYTHFWVAERNREKQEIVGMVGLLRKTESLAQIRHLMVEEDQKDKTSIMKQLLHTSLKFAKDKNYSEVEVLTSAVDEEVARLFVQAGLKLKSTFFMPSKHLYILPMQVLHVKVDEVNIDSISDESEPGSLTE